MRFLALGNDVSLVKVDDSGGDLKKRIVQALDLIGFKPSGDVKSVVIKPNLCYYWDWSTGYTTDPRVVSALIDLVREWHGKNVDIKVAEADASAMRTRHAFPVLGYEKLATEKRVKLVNLSKDLLENRVLKVDGREISVKIPQLLLNSDLFLNVPKLKVMRETTITCAMKNVFGCMGVPKKMIYHPLLSQAIVGMNMILRPHLTIVDGLVALGGHPMKMGLLMASVDAFSVDWIASKIMGYDPSRIGFLKLAVKENVGSPEGVTAKGESIEEFRKMFPKPGFRSSRYSWKLLIWLLKAYHRASGDIIPPVLEEGD